MNKEIEEKIFAEYEKTLVIPNIKPSRQFLLCPVGLVGAGKTTVVKPLAEKLGLVRISGDEIRGLLKKNGFGYEKTFEIGSRLAENFLGDGYSVAIDSDCASGHTRKLIKDAKNKYGAIAIWIHINPPEEFILNKLKNYKHTWLFKNSDEALKNYYDRKPVHKKLEMEFTYVFDSSKKNLSKQIEEAFTIIKNKL